MQTRLSFALSTVLAGVVACANPAKQSARGSNLVVQRAASSLPPPLNGTGSTAARESTATEKCLVIEAVAQALKQLDVAANDTSIKTVVAWTNSVTAYLDDHPISHDRQLLMSSFPDSAILVDSFVAVASQKTEFRCEGRTPSVIWANLPRMDELWDRREESWERHLARLEPRAAGLGGFSDVAFSNDGNTALVYAFLQYGDLGGEGKYWLVTKDKDGWKVKSRANIWIS